jgi:hypothetical protein
MWWMKYFAHRKVQNCRQRGKGKTKGGVEMKQEESKTKLDSFIIEYTIAAKALKPHMTQSGDQNVCFQNTLFCT